MSADILLPHLTIQSSHRCIMCGFEPDTGHMWDKLSSACGCAMCFFSGFSRFRATNRLNRHISERSIAIEQSVDRLIDQSIYQSMSCPIITSDADTDVSSKFLSFSKFGRGFHGPCEYNTYRYGQKRIRYELLRIYRIDMEGLFAASVASVCASVTVL